MAQPVLNIVEFVAVDLAGPAFAPDPNQIPDEHAAALASEARAEKGKQRRLFSVVVAVVAVVDLVAVVAVRAVGPPCCFLPCQHVLTLFVVAELCQLFNERYELERRRCREPDHGLVVAKKPCMVEQESRKFFCTCYCFLFVVLLVQFSDMSETQSAPIAMIMSDLRCAIFRHVEICM